MRAASPSPSLGIYISVPFCRAKCTYCNFASGVFSRERMGRYVDRLCDDLGTARDHALAWGSRALPQTVDTIYLGGGTPSLLPAAELHRLFARLRSEFAVLEQAEVTMECAPGQISDDLLHALPALGVNRISLGVQSFVDQEAAAVGRLHTRAQVLDDLERLRAAGIARINIDLIAGLPFQSEDSWRESLEVLIDTGVTHASVYVLEVDEHSRLGREMTAGGLRYYAPEIPDDDQIAGFYDIACERLNQAGVAQYEISNFARPAAESKHNIKYWTRAPYLGVGLDAHSMLLRDSEGPEAVRLAETDDLSAYLQGTAPAEATFVNAKGAIEEALFLGLRMNRGMELEALAQQFGEFLRGAMIAALGAAAEELQADGLLQAYEGQPAHRMTLRLTPRGRLLANDVFARLIDAVSVAAEPHALLL